MNEGGGCFCSMSWWTTVLSVRRVSVGWRPCWSSRRAWAIRTSVGGAASNTRCADRASPCLYRTYRT